MGRYIRKKRRKQGDSTIKGKAFNLVECDRLEEYLSYYHYAANEACFPGNGADSDDDDEVTLRMSNRQSTVFENDVTYIKGHEFPALKPDVLEQPYLVLPPTLNPKERRKIYELCIHCDLYHTGTSNKKDHTRYTVVSPHPDGLTHVPDLEEPTHFPVNTCKPWFYRNDNGGECPNPSPYPTEKNENGVSNNSTTSCIPRKLLSRHEVQESTKKHKLLIEDLMAYPYQCLRPRIDTVENILSYQYINTPPNSHASRSTMVLVDSVEKIKQCALELSNAVSSSQLTEVGFDLEAYNVSKYQQATCLIQLSTNLGHEYVIDVLSPGVWDHVSSTLRPIFANKSIVKIGHGICSIDVPCLHRDFGIFIINVFDTYEAASQLEKLKKHLSLSKLCNYYELEKDAERHAMLKDLYQNCDWRQRPLGKDQVEYCVKDVRYLIPLRKLMLRDLCHNDSVPTRIFGAMKAESSLTESSRELLGRAETLDLSGTTDPQSQDGSSSGRDIVQAASRCSEDDDNSFFTAHDDNDNKTQATMESAQEEIDEAIDAQLRYNQVLMEVLKMSQKGCLSLWTNKSENEYKNSTLVEFLKRADRLSGDNDTTIKSDAKVFTREDMSLYLELVKWRKDVAKKAGILSPMLCDLDLLARIAYKRPRSLTSLMRLSYFLPVFFREEAHSGYLDELFSIVAAASNDSLANTDAMVRMYSDRKVKKKQKNSSVGMCVARTMQNVDEEDNDDSSTMRKDLTVEDESVTMDTSGKFNYKKLTMTAVIGVIMTAAVVGVRVMKQRK